MRSFSVNENKEMVQVLGGEVMGLRKVFLRWEVLQHSDTLMRKLVLQLGKGIIARAESEQD